MKKLVVYIAVLFSVGLNAQRLEKGLLWKISGNGIDSPSYIFGTMHATCTAALPSEVLTALDNTQGLYLEIDMDSPNLLEEMRRYSTMKGGAKISDMMGEDDFIKLDAFLKREVGISATLLNTYKPALVESLLLPKMLPCEMQSLEVNLMKYAQLQQEEIYGLETIADQLSVFDEISYEEQAESLLNTAKDNFEASTAELETLMELYEAGDLNKILEYMKEDSNPFFSKHLDVLLTNRNKNWIIKIEETVKREAVFFAVGAAHLAGDEGVINLLRKRGFVLEPVTSK